MEQQNNKEHLHILWTNADVTTAKLMVMMYARNAMKNGWWKEVTVIVWGATVKLLAENEELQEELKTCRILWREIHRMHRLCGRIKSGR